MIRRRSEHGSGHGCRCGAERGLRDSAIIESGELFAELAIKASCIAFAWPGTGS